MPPGSGLPTQSIFETAEATSKTAVDDLPGGGFHPSAELPTSDRPTVASPGLSTSRALFSGRPLNFPSAESEIPTARLDSTKRPSAARPGPCAGRVLSDNAFKRIARTRFSWVIASIVYVSLSAGSPTTRTERSFSTVSTAPDDDVSFGFSRSCHPTPFRFRDNSHRRWRLSSSGFILSIRASMAARFCRCARCFFSNCFRATVEGAIWMSFSSALLKKANNP